MAGDGGVLGGAELLHAGRDRRGGEGHVARGIASDAVVADRLLHVVLRAGRRVAVALRHQVGLGGGVGDTGLVGAQVEAGAAGGVVVVISVGGQRNGARLGGVSVSGGERGVEQGEGEADVDVGGGDDGAGEDGGEGGDAGVTTAAQPLVAGADGAAAVQVLVDRLGGGGRLLGVEAVAAGVGELLQGAEGGKQVEHLAEIGGARGHHASLGEGHCAAAAAGG